VEFDVKRILDTLEEVAAKVKDPVFLVVGRGLAGEEALLQRQAVERGLDAHLVQVGWAPIEMLPKYFAAAEIALYPMDDTLLNRTKCPAKLRDLLSAGVPVVADRVGQAAEYITDGATGVLVPPGDSRAMATAAAGLLSDGELRRRLGEAARGDFRARWTWRVWLPVVEQALAAALAAARPGSASQRG
jgi:glycosyltransferase involved in cell wall biosynthesis